MSQLVRIDAIRKRRGGMMALISGEHELMRIDAQLCAELALTVPCELSGERLDEIEALSQKRRTERRAMYLVACRDHSRAELTRKLRRSSDAQSAQETVEKLERLGLVDDEDYALQLARRLLSQKKFGQRRVVQELYAKGIGRELAQQAIDEAMDELEYDAVESILALFEGKFAFDPEDESDKRRTVAALQRYGYGWGEISSALRRYERD